MNRRGAVAIAVAVMLVGAAADAAKSYPAPTVVTRATRGWRQRGEIHDVTARWRTNYQAALAGTLRKPRDAAQVVVLNVPGVMGNQMPGYFRGAEQHLDARGYDRERGAIHTLDDLEPNAAALAAQARAHIRAGKDVVFLPHSYGGPVALAAALELVLDDPTCIQHIRGFAFEQSALQGVPGSGLMNNPMGWLGLKAMRARGGLFRDLSPHVMKPQLQRALATLSEVPMLTLATSAEAKGGVRGRIGRAFARGGPGDGAVPRWSQMIPGTHAVILDDMDHGEPVFDLPGRSYEQGPLAESLIVTMMNLPRPTGR